VAGAARFQTRSSLSTWLHRIAVNVSLAKRRKASPVEPSLEHEEGARGALEWTLETPVEVREIEAAIGALPEGARDALVLHALYGYSHGEAAQMLVWRRARARPSCTGRANCCARD